MNQYEERMRIGHIKIEKCVAEFLIWDKTNFIPNGCFAVKVYRKPSGLYEGITSIEVIDKDGDYYCTARRGNSIEDALNNTVIALYNRVNDIKDNTNSAIRRMDVDMF